MTRGTILVVESDVSSTESFGEVSVFWSPKNQRRLGGKVVVFDVILLLLLFCCI